MTYHFQKLEDGSMEVAYLAALPDNTTIKVSIIGEVKQVSDYLLDGTQDTYRIPCTVFQETAYTIKTPKGQNHIILGISIKSGRPGEDLEKILNFLLEKQREGGVVSLPSERQQIPPFFLSRE